MRGLLIALLVAGCGVAGCGDTGQPAVEHRAVATGVAPHAIELGDYRVTLEQARVGFGPAVFCASRAASNDQCPSALAELAVATQIDALSPTPQPLGTVNGFTGTVRSAGFEYAITWLSHQSTPVAARASLSGHSAHLEGTATHRTSGASFRFVADVDVVPLTRGEHAVSVSELNAPLDNGTRSLTVRIDPTNWLGQVDFAELAALATPTVTIAPGSRAHNALVIGMTSLAPPQFAWSR